MAGYAYVFHRFIHTTSLDQRRFAHHGWVVSLILALGLVGTA